MGEAYAGRPCGSERMVGRMVVGLDVPPLWLRDACTCGECRDEFSGQRLRSVLTLDPETGIASWRDDGDEIEVTFAPDGHVSRFSRSWLSANAPGRAEVFDDRSERHRPPWRAADLGGRPPVVTWPDLNSAVEPRAAALGALMRTGVLLVRDVPVEPGMVLAVARSFGHVRTTNYGDLFDVRVESQPVNLAYTGRAIAPHTDNPYREPGPRDPAAALPAVVSGRGRERLHRRLRRGRAGSRRGSPGVHDADVDTADVQVRGRQHVAARQRPDHHASTPLATCGRSAGTIARSSRRPWRRTTSPRSIGRCGPSRPSSSDRSCTST